MAIFFFDATQSSNRHSSNQCLDQLLSRQSQSVAVNLQFVVKLGTAHHDLLSTFEAASVSEQTNCRETFLLAVCL